MLMVGRYPLEPSDSIINKKIDENEDQLDIKDVEAEGEKIEDESTRKMEGSGLFPFLARLLELKADPMRVNVMGDDAVCLWFSRIIRTTWSMYHQILLAQIRGSKATKELLQAWIKVSGGIQNLKETLKRLKLERLLDLAHWEKRIKQASKIYETFI